MPTPPKVPGMGAFTDHFDKNSGTPRPTTPATVVTAARLMMIAALIQVLSSVVAVVYAASPDRIPAIQKQLDAMSGAVPSITSMQNMNVITVSLAGLATIGAYVAFAYFLNKGRSWARVVAGLWVALTLVQLVGITFPAGWTTVSQLILGGVAIALCYLPRSNDYFAAIKAGNK